MINKNKIKGKYVNLEIIIIKTSNNWYKKINKWKNKWEML